jgi:hypothetical protein
MENPKYPFESYTPEGGFWGNPRLWSLWDMLRFYAAAFLAVTHNLEATRGMLLGAQHFGGASVKIDWDEVERHIAEIGEELKKIPVSFSLQKQVERALGHAKQRNLLNLSHLISIIGEIAHNLMSELADHLFLCVSSDLKWHYLTPERVVGLAFESAFPDAVKDAHSGIRCFILDQWTASVFHFMRVLEHGIRYLAAEVGLAQDGMAFENWKNIIDQIEKQIKAMEQLPKSDEKMAKLTYFSEASANFRYFKDAWRNHVSHSRINYDSTDAKRVMDHVLDFMQQLAKKISA